MQTLIFLHRWIGVVLAAFMTLWFGSGLIIALSDPLSTDQAARLAHAPYLAQQPGWLGPAEAWRRGDDGPLPGEARLVRAARGGYWLFRTFAGEVQALSAVDGTKHVFSPEEAEQIAADWFAAPGEEASSQSRIVYLDTGEAPAFLRNAQGLGPFHTLAVDDGWGTEIIISSRSGDVVAVASAPRRGLYYASSWLHNFHPLDFLGETRRLALALAGGFAAAASLTGLVLGWKRWRPGLFGRPTYAGGRRQPYRRFWLASHFWSGLIGGTFALLWAFSGFVNAVPAGLFSPAGAAPREIAAFFGPAGQIVDAPPPSHDIGNEVALVWRRLGDQTILFGETGDGSRFRLPHAAESFAPEVLFAAAQRLAGAAPIVAQTELSGYDSYYYRNRRQSALDRPLPVLRVDLGDAAATRLYIDPDDGRILLKADSSRRAYRWLFTALHHWDFGWLAWRPAWLGWMLISVSLGLGLAVSALVLAWRRLQLTWRAQIAARSAKLAQQAGTVEA